MNPDRSLFSWSFLVGLCFVTSLGVVTAFSLFFIVLSILGSANYLAADLIMTLTFGSAIALAQGSILRRFGQPSVAWTRATLLGFLIAGPGVLILGGNFGPVIVSGLGVSLVLGSILGVAQWLVLKKKVSQAALWIAISIASWLAAGWISNTLFNMRYDWGPILFWLGLFISGIVLSSAGLMWLIDRAKIVEIPEDILPQSALLPSSAGVLEARQARIAEGQCPRCGAQVRSTEQNCPSCQINLAFARENLDQR